MKSIGGTMILHNAVEFDYCFREALLSMVPFCDEIVALECESTDTTRGELERLCAEHPKIRIVSGVWRPGRGGFWLSEATNVARLALNSDYHVNLQADEVFEESATTYASSWADKNLNVQFNRLNFWITPWHLVPEGTTCGDWIVRAAAKSRPSVGDAESLEPTCEKSNSKARIFHYGFLRHPAAYAKKTRHVQTAWTGGYDPVADKVEAEGLGAFENSHPLSKCRPWSGQHPRVAHQWLKDRGHRL